MGALSLFRYIMNNEVTRLRRLRKTALKLRALALALDAGKCEGSAYERASLVSWRIARIATGRLRSHPYRSYQRDPGYFEGAADRFNSYLQAALANMRGQGMRVFLQQMTAAARELDDTRALTLCADLSDALGRAQQNVRALIDEVRLHMCRTSGQDAQACGKQSTSSLANSHVPASPYLAL
jgi:hypothetical protein